MSSNILGRKVVRIASEDVGASTGSKKHLAIIKDFNTVKPHGYTASPKDFWCDEAVSAWYIRAGLTAEDVPLSCNVEVSIADAKKLGIWKNRSHKARPGDAIVLDWDMNGFGNHIGIVEKVDADTVYTIEGNAGDQGVCKRKQYPRSSKIILGYICPKFNAILINKRAMEYSYPLHTEKSVITSKPNKAYRKAWKKYFPKRNMTIACHTFVMLVMRSCGFKIMPLGWSDIIKYLKQRCKVVKFDHKASQLRKGDIMIYKRVDSKGAHYHIWVIVEVEGKLYMAEARQAAHYAPYKRNTAKALKQYSKTWLFRVKEEK